MTASGVRILVLALCLALYAAVGVVCLLLAVSGEGLHLVDVVSALTTACAATRIARSLREPSEIVAIDGVLS